MALMSSAGISTRGMSGGAICGTSIQGGGAGTSNEVPGGVRLARRANCSTSNLNCSIFNLARSTSASWKASRALASLTQMLLGSLMFISMLLRLVAKTLRTTAVLVRMGGKWIHPDGPRVRVFRVSKSCCSSFSQVVKVRVHLGNSPLTGLCFQQGILQP